MVLKYLKKRDLKHYIKNNKIRMEIPAKLQSFFHNPSFMSNAAPEIETSSIKDIKT
jgi:hypothetical protein